MAQSISLKTYNAINHKTMKKIHLLRHAKSSWGNASLADIDRPLNARGMNTAAFMAPHLLEAGCALDHVFCSPAVRAQATISLISKHLPTIDLTWVTDQDLYTFDSNKLLQWFQNLDESIDELLIIGHNPAFTNLCNLLSHHQIQNIPTCGYVQLTATQTGTWQAISETPFELTTFIRPKALMKDSEH